MRDVELMVNYIYLDMPEINNLRLNKQEYLFEQIQFFNSDITNPRINKINIDFTNPCKLLFWVFKKIDYISGNYYFGTDIENATKRFILAFCRKNTTNFLDADGVNLSVGSNLVPVDNLSSDVSVIIENATVNKLFKSGSDATIHDIKLSNDYLLTSEQISLTVDKFILKYASLATRNTTGEGSIDNDISIYQWDNFNLNIDYTDDILSFASLEIDGYERFIKQPYQFYNMCQSSESYKNMVNGTYLYSFSLDPSNHQPSCILNFSKIKKSRLLIEYNSKFIDSYYDNNTSFTLLSVYAKSYNIITFEKIILN